MEEGGTGRFAGHARSRAQEVLEQILSSKDARALVGMSQKTYSDQPILRTGADFARERAQRRKEGRDAARIAREQRVERRHQQPPAAAIRQTGEAGSVATASSWPSFSFVMPGLDAREDSDPANSELPPALQELRRLEGDGLRLGELFCRQARLAQRKRGYPHENAFVRQPRPCGLPSLSLPANLQGPWEP